MYMRNNTGPSSLPCGIPKINLILTDKEYICFVSVLLAGNELIYFNILFSIAHDSSLFVIQY